MSKRLILVFIGLSLLLSFHLYSAKTSDLQAAKEQACKLVDEGKYAEASALIDALIAENAENPNLPEVLYWVAERYRWAHKWQEARDLYQYISQNYPNNPFATRASLGIARAGVLSLIVAEDFIGAEEALDKMIADFSEKSDVYVEADMPETLYWIARGFGYKNRHQLEKSIYENIVQNYPDSPYAQKAKLGIERAQAQSLIASGKTEEAKKQIDKMKEDFSSHPDLQDAVYWIGTRYEWTGRFDEANEVYQNVKQNEPNGLLADKAKLSLSKTNIKSLIVSQNYEKTKDALNKLMADFGENKIPFNELVWIAEKYETIGDVNIACGMYEQIVRDCPVGENTTAAGEDTAVLAKAHLAKYELFSAIDAGDKNRVDTMVRQMGSELVKTEPNGLPLVCTTNGVDLYLDTIALACYNRGWKLKIEGNTNKANDYFTTEVAIWERIFTEFPNSPLAAVECFRAAVVSGQELGDYGKAVEYFQKVAGDWPDFENADLAQFKVAEYLEAMVKQNLLPVEQTKTAIIEAYHSVIDNYPNSEYVKRAEAMLKNYEK